MDWDTIKDVAVSEMAIRLLYGLGGAIITGVTFLIGTILLGRGYKRRFADIESQIKELFRQPPQATIQNTITFALTDDGKLVHVDQATNKPLVGRIISVHMPERIARVGTKHGTFEIAFGDNPRILIEIAKMLEKNGILAPLEPRQGPQKKEAST